MNNPLLTIDDTAFDASSDTLKNLIFTGSRFTRIPNALGHLHVLDNLLIEDTKIDDWNSDVLEQIGKTVTSLTSDNVGFLAWPAWIQYFPNLETLEITNFNMSTAPDNALDAQRNKMSNLRIEEGTLSEIPEAISKLSSLNSLSLDGNRITHIANLPSFGNLTTLSVDSNSLSDANNVRDALRSVSDSLIILQMENNHLAAFPNLSFMTKLQSAYFSNNDILDVVSGSLPPSVIYCEIEDNYFRSIPTFLPLEGNLVTLRMAGNAVTRIEGVQLPPSISDLDLAGNKITHLSNWSFPQNSRLNYLTLDHNPLSSIEPLAFAVLKHMQFLSLRDTKLTRLPLALTTLTQLNTVDLTLNADLVCTCLDKPLRAWALALNLQSFGDCGATSIDNFLRVLSAGCPD